MARRTETEVLRALAAEAEIFAMDIDAHDPLGHHADKVRKLQLLALEARVLREREDIRRIDDQIAQAFALGVASDSDTE